jgi:hypothetical protein
MFKKALGSILALLAITAMTSCKKSSSTDSSSTAASTDLVISGTLAAAASSAKVTGSVQKMAQNAAMAVSLTDLEFYAIAFTSPPAIATGTVNADGSFTTTLTGAKGSAVTAIFRDKTDNSQVGVVVFQDTSKKDLDGNAKESSSIVLSDSVSLGAITLGTDGKVTIPVSQIESQIASSDAVAAGTAFDPTGVWYMKAYDGTVPTGYQTVGAAGGGPTVGFPLTLIRFTGKDFTPGTGCTSKTACAATAGTDGSDRYALSIWGDTAANGIGGCGYKAGFTGDEARYKAHLNIATWPTVSGTAIAEGAYSYVKATGFGGDAAPFNLDWMKTGATAQHPVQDCRPTTVAGKNGWACKSDRYLNDGWPGTVDTSAAVGWNVGVEGGGCLNATTLKPVNVTNWSSLGMGTCTNVDSSATYGAGFTTNTCTFTNVSPDGTAAAINITCSNINGQFVDNAGAPDFTTPITSSVSGWANRHLGMPKTLLAQGALCSSAGSSTTAATLSAYRCYAEAYWQGISSATETACMRDYNFNWAARTAAEFADDSGRGKPKNAFITNILNYSTDGQTATLEDEEKEKITVNTGANSSTFCEVSRRTILTFKKVSDTRLLVDLKESGQMQSTAAACIGAAKDALAGKNVGGGDLQRTLQPQNMIFYVDTTL